MRYFLIAIILLAAVTAGLLLGNPGEEKTDVESIYTFDEAAQFNRNENWAEANKAYQYLLAQNPYHGNFWVQAGWVQYNLKDYDAAVVSFKKAIELGHSEPSSLYNIACILSLQDKPEEAVEWLQKAIRKGFVLRNSLDTDSDLANIKNNPDVLRKLQPIVTANTPRVEGWLADVAFLSQRMQLAHYDVFGVVSKPDWEAAVNRLQRNIPDMQDHEIIVEMMKLVTLVGDGHTGLWPPAGGKQGFHQIPVQMYWFKDGMFIRSAAPDYKSAVGAKVLKIGDTPIMDAIEKVTPLIHRDNDMGIKSRAPRYLGTAEVLHALRISPNANEITLQIEKDGQKNQVAFSTIPLQFGNHGRPGWVSMNDDSNIPKPLWQKKPGEISWFEYLPEHKLVYFQHNQIRNSPGETVAQFSKRLRKFIEENEVEALVIDIRRNGGGNNFLNRPLLYELIRCEKIYEQGKLFAIIIGRVTFSAAMNLTADLEQHTPAIFVGEPSGSRPNFIGETNIFTLPYSGLRISASNRYWQRTFSHDYRTWIAPDIIAEMTSDDFKNNIDPAMEAILRYLKRKQDGKAL